MMMKKHYIKVPVEVSEYLERLHYETLAMEGIVTKILRGDITCDEEKFDKYHKDYLALHTEYQIAKQSLHKTFVPAVFGEHRASWEMDFANHTLVITQHCDCEVEL